MGEVEVSSSNILRDALKNIDKETERRFKEATLRAFAITKKLTAKLKKVTKNQT